MPAAPIQPDDSEGVAGRGLEPTSRPSTAMIADLHVHHAAAPVVCCEDGKGTSHCAGSDKGRTETREFTMRWTCSDQQRHPLHSQMTVPGFCLQFQNRIVHALLPDHAPKSFQIGTSVAIGHATQFVEIQSDAPTGYMSAPRSDRSTSERSRQQQLGRPGRRGCSRRRRG